jgi:decaprenylphospho-beta-D-ribofuranose 2-oxidase
VVPTSAAEAEAGEATLLAGWGATSPSLARVVRPAEDEVAGLMRSAPVRGVLPRGLGRSYGDAAQNAGGRVLDMTALGGIRALDPATGEVTVAAGTSLATLLRATLPLGWFPAVVPGTRFVTVGGAIAADLHGKNHHRDGSFAGHVTRFVLVTPDGERREVSPGDEAWGATVGGMGLSGVIVEARLRLRRVESAWMRADTDPCPDLDDVMARMEREDAAFPYSVAWLDLLRGGRAILLRADHARADELDGRRPVEPGGERALAVPPLPRSLVGPLTARAFNAAWYHRAARAGHGRLERAEPYFFPLDGLRRWPRLYGPRGFLQHQLVVPVGAEEALRAIVARYAAARAPAAVVVFKRLGRGGGGLSFPIPGWTLTVDLPAAWDGLAPLLDGIDELVAEAGGRLYLAKDSRMRPELLGAMYPELERWRELRARMDPDRRMRSDLARRLELA